MRRHSLSDHIQSVNLYFDGIFVNQICRPRSQPCADPAPAGAEQAEPVQEEGSRYREGGVHELRQQGGQGGAEETGTVSLSFIMDVVCFS